MRKKDKFAPKVCCSHDIVIVKLRGKKELQLTPPLPWIFLQEIERKVWLYMKQSEAVRSFRAVRIMSYGPLTSHGPNPSYDYYTTWNPIFGTKISGNDEKYIIRNSVPTNQSETFGPPRKFSFRNFGNFYNFCLENN